MSFLNFHLLKKSKTLLLAFFVVFLTACGDKDVQKNFQGKTMGTTYHVDFVDSDDSVDVATLKKDVDQVLIEVNNAMSTYQKNSEITLFNKQAKAFQAVEISQDFATVVQEAIELNNITKGKLDVTVGPIVNLFGFGPDKRLNKVPSSEQLAKVSKFIGINHIALKKGNGKFYLIKDQDGVYIDLSSIAKGFGVDKVAEFLESKGIENYLVEIGGELRIKGKKANDDKWKIAIEKPNLIQGSEIQTVISVDNLGMATSGNYRNYFEDENGVRLSHIIDPVTKMPITHNLASITVLAPTSMHADGLATGLFVMGKDKALEVAEKEHLAVYLIVKEKDGFKAYHSSAFEQLTK